MKCRQGVYAAENIVFHAAFFPIGGVELAQRFASGAGAFDSHSAHEELLSTSDGNFMLPSRLACFV